MSSNHIAGSSGKDFHLERNIVSPLKVLFVLLGISLGENLLIDYNSHMTKPDISQ